MGKIQVNLNFQLLFDRNLLLKDCADNKLFAGEELYIDYLDILHARTNLINSMY